MRIVDARTLSNGTEIETDVCIVGAGAAGITLAREFACWPFKVCLLESGGLEFAPDIQDLYDGRNAGVDYISLDAPRLRFFGGTTNHWAGRCGKFWPSDFQERLWVPHSGWPFGHEELEPYVEKAARLCELPSSDFDPEPFLKANGGAPLDFDRSLIQYVLFHLSPPTRFGERDRADIEASENVFPLINATVLRFKCAEDARMVHRVDLATLDGKKLGVRARLFILAAGAIESARLLLLSTDDQPKGLGNEHDVVGRYFMEHPYVPTGVMVVTDSEADLSLKEGGDYPRSRMMLQLSEKAAEKEGICNYVAQFRPIGMLRSSEAMQSLREILRGLKRAEVPSNFTEHLGNIFRDFDDVYSALYTSMVEGTGNVPGSRLYEISTNAEMAPNPDSRVTLYGDRDRFGQQKIQLDMRFSEIDNRTHRRGTEILGKELTRLGVGRVRLMARDQLAGTPGMDYGYHHMGTLRMHRDPRYGVVDADARVHGVSNLYVMGSSVFPTSGVGTPTLSIVALSLRLADHLKETQL
jgi:choline dehydrogenase-like flavoprotein